jgi:hypothetical protein
MVIDNFEHNNINYEIRLIEKEHTYIVRAFRNHIPANGFCYECNFDSRIDLIQLQSVDIIKEFSGMAKEDVIEDRWNQLLEALNQNS